MDRMIIAGFITSGQYKYSASWLGLNTRASRAPYEPPGGGSCGGNPPLFPRRRWIVLANVSGVEINKPKLAWPAAQA